MNEIALNKFYERLEKAKDRKWFLTETGMIRCFNDTKFAELKTCLCPLEMAGCAESFKRAGANLGLTSNETWMIADAADGDFVNAPVRAQIRARLLSILGLSEVEA